MSNGATAVLAITLLAITLLAAPVVAQTAGANCGPSHAKAGSYKWVKIESKSLAATQPTGSVPGTAGCATSDGGQFAHVSLELPDGIHHVHAVSFKGAWKSQSDSGDKGLEISAGNANMTRWFSKLRGPRTEAEKVFENFRRCHLRRNYAASGRQNTIVCNEEVEVSGQWVVVIAKGLQVCDVMVCASQVHFGHDGAAKTHYAAVKLQTGGKCANGLSVRSADPAALPETCSGAACFGLLA
jgi:hypothetical protein